MEYTRVKYLWIDQHCIKQEGEAKVIGMNAMDRVFSRSSHPVALLTRPINSSSELVLLTRVLDGRLVCEDSDGLWLSRNTSLEQALEALELLKDITLDVWFSRGWTFQENYKAGTKMKLLIPHRMIMNRLKVSKLMGGIDGELCIDSVKFHEETTKLCFAYQSHHPIPASLSNHLLSRAGKYTILLQYESDDGNNVAPQSMSPRIIADLATRNLTNLWDRLPIVANCCQYSVRLNSSQLQAEGRGLGMSMLALCLLNGEILSNHPDENIHVSALQALPIIEFLREQFFDELKSPFVNKALTYNKGCRLVDVELTEEGIHTRGHLWKCDRLISTERVRRTSRLRNNTSSTRGLKSWEIRRLEQLVSKLFDHREKRLEKLLGHFIARHRKPRRVLSFSRRWMIQMASILADAIDQGKTLCTAHLFGSQGSGDAIFIVDPRLKDQNYVFTSIRSKRGDSRRSYFNDIDKHVSLEVDLGNPEGIRRGKWLPMLFTKRWIIGLCFFSRDSLQDVVFPWPMSLQGL